MTITRDVVRAVHLGERTEEGIRWSGDTQDRQLALVTPKAPGRGRGVPGARLRREGGAGYGEEGRAPGG